MPGYDGRTPPPPPVDDRILYVVVGLIGLALLALVTAIVARDYVETRQRAEAGLANLAAALERDIARDVELFDLDIRAAAEALDLPGLAQANPALRHAALFGRAAAPDDLSTILLTDRDGGVLATSDAAGRRPASLADRPAFRYLREHPDAGLYVGAPPVGADDPVIVFARRITRPDGSFGGIATGDVPVDYFRKLFAPFDVGPGGAIALIRTDGTLLARAPAAAGAIGRNIAESDGWARMAQAQAGVMDGVSAIDGASRVFAFRRLGAQPLLVVVSDGRHAVFAVWRREAVLVLSSTAALLVGAGTLLVALRRQLRRRTVAEHRALASAEAARRSERMLALSLAQLDTVFQHSADAHFAASRRGDGRFAFDLLNRRGEELTGLRAESTVGRTPEECLPPEIAATVQTHWQRCLDGGKPISYEQALWPSADRVSWEIHLVPVHDSHGAICRLIGTARDVTDRIKAETSLRDLNSTLERRAAAATAAQDDALARASTAERLQLLGRLASGIAHDVNNVLQSVAGGAALVERRADEPHKARHAARLIADAAARGASITNRLLTFSREDGCARQPVAVAPLLHDLADILHHTLRADGPIDIRVHCDDDPALTVFSDRNQLQTVLLNLATNARDAMPGGGTIVLGAGVGGTPPADLPPGSYVRLWVEDDGSGMDPAILARVTEPFFTTKPVGKGTGLGLSMAEAFAREAGGRLTIDSRLGRGTSVALWLPR